MRIVLLFHLLTPFCNFGGSCTYESSEYNFPTTDSHHELEATRLGSIMLYLA
jgi:hypothetical protein